MTDQDSDAEVIPSWDNVPTRQIAGEWIKSAEAAKWQKKLQHEPAIA
ncbi:hypothetical protein [Edaphobacter modestus]|nr:hypothetical protein [Edaphobacter modestus]